MPRWMAIMYATAAEPLRVGSASATSPASSGRAMSSHVLGAGRPSVAYIDGLYTMPKLLSTTPTHRGGAPSVVRSYNGTPLRSGVGNASFSTDGSSFTG